MKSNIKTAVILIVGILFVISCESNPIRNNETSSVPEPGAGIPADQINWVSWNPEVLDVIRAKPDTASIELSRLGSDFQFITTANGGTVGGPSTYDNMVWFPPNTMSYDSFVGIQAACSDAETFFSDLSALVYIDAAIAELDALSAELADNAYISYIDLAYEGLARTKAFFAVYASHSNSAAFLYLMSYVTDQMQAAALAAANGNIDTAYIPAFRYVSEMALYASQIMAASTWVFANDLDQPNGSYLTISLNYYNYGNMYSNVAYAPLTNLGYEWYLYTSALNYYRYSWIYAQAAIPADTGPCSAAVDYMPSQQFMGPVEVTLSWGALDFNGNPDELVVYWYNEETELWVLISDPVIDYETQTISVWVDHFTRFGWGIGGEEPIGD